jgi:hypothetical protein
MTKDWKKIARASGLPILDAELERITPVLDALEAAFRPLTEDLPPSLDPAVTFQPEPEDE